MHVSRDVYLVPVHQRKVFDGFAMAHIRRIKLVIRQSIRTSKTRKNKCKLSIFVVFAMARTHLHQIGGWKNKCKLLIATLLSGIVGKSGALTTFHFLLDLGIFNMLPCSL